MMRTLTAAALLCAASPLLAQGAGTELPDPNDRSNTLTIAVARVRPDSYLVRAQVDGAQSPLTIGAIPPLPPTPANLRYVEPRIEIP